jgi:hypothetical protein
MPPDGQLELLVSAIPHHSPEKRMKGETVVIRWNNFVAPDPCALCGEEADPREGPEIFLEGTYETVCRACMEREAPELVALLDDVCERGWDTERWKERARAIEANRAEDAENAAFVR